MYIEHLRVLLPQRREPLPISCRTTLKIENMKLKTPAGALLSFLLASLLYLRDWLLQCWSWLLGVTEGLPHYRWECDGMERLVYVHFTNNISILYWHEINDHDDALTHSIMSLLCFATLLSLQIKVL